MMLVMLLAVLVTTAGCGADRNTAGEPAIATAKVARGDIMVDITAAGNLALSLFEDMVFEISGTTQEPLTVSEVLVEEGEAVTAGQLLLTLDVTTIEAKIKTREESLKTAELNLRSAKYDLDKAVSDAIDNVNNAEIDFGKAVTDGASNVSNAEVDLERAADTYRKIIYPYTFTTLTLDVPSASSRIKTARQGLDQVLLNLAQAVPSTETVEIGSEHSAEALKINVEVYEQILVDIQAAAAELVSAVNTLDPGSGAGLLEASMLSVSDYWALKTAEQTLEKSQTTLEKVISTANTSIAKSRNTLDKAIIAAETSVEKSRIAYERTQISFQQAEDNLLEARAELTKVEIVAPFDGFVTQLSVEGGDAVSLGAVAVQVADPNRFETKVLVSEMDISQLAEGGTARVTVDSLSGVSLPATITHISPRASIQSGVVNYVVTVEIAPLEAGAAPRPEAREGSRPQLQPGEMPERMQQVIDSGQITREQAEAMLKRIQEGGAQGGGFSAGGGFGQNGQSALRAPQTSGDIQLRQGLSVTVTLVVDQAADVLLVPNTAISYQGAQAYVQIMTAAGEIEPREISVGISNWTDTAVTEGLTEGETIVTSRISAAADDDADNRGRSSIGGMSRMFR